MTRLFLAPDVHAAVVGLDLVLLDVRRDAYFCLPGVTPHLTGPVTAGELRGLSDELGQDLLDARMAQAGRDVRPAPLAVIRPCRDLTTSAAVRPTRLELLSFACGLAELGRTYWRRPFRQVLAHAAERRRALGDPGPDRAQAAIRRCRAFQALLPWSPIQGACLLQSALLLAYLDRIGVAADWVFGVRTWPFSAHCWLQAGDLVLNDTVERVGPYVPILKV